ncbi:MAG: T9SS type A sorting domain-containing protein [Dokdonia sp.]|jgi:cyanophycinase-like exopeptidase
MKQFILLVSIVMCCISTICGQNYTSYFTGNSTDVMTVPSGGVCLMGGATEDDNAMTWFLQQANGGDVLVLRTSGSDGYNDYMYSSLGVSLNSVETIVFHDATASDETYIHQKIAQAEAIWIAGGDQWDYISYWRNTAIDSLINEAIATRNIVIGGTSAGMAIQGGYYFSAQNGTITSSTALSDPYDTNVTVDSMSFISNPFLSDVITDSHYDNPDRKGRHLVFLARILVDEGVAARGIACDEYTAVCIDTNGIAKVYGEYPSHNDNAYFIQTNCELESVLPENCTAGNSLDWNLGNEAIKVYSVKGTPDGSNTFDLNDWETGTGGLWENWYVDNGVLNQQSGIAPSCNSLSISTVEMASFFQIYPNPTSNQLRIDFDHASSPNSLRILNRLGQIKKELHLTAPDSLILNLSDLSSGIYFIEVKNKANGSQVKKLIIN